MSDVNLVFTVNSVSSTFTVDTTTVNVTPNTTAINMYAGYAAYPPNGAVGNSQVLFNDAGLYGGVPEFTYNKNDQYLSVTNFKAYYYSDLGLASNVKISGGVAGQVLSTNGSGGLTWANTAQGQPSQLQFNDYGNINGVTNVTYDGTNLSLGEIANVKILGGTNGYVLQTDGTGNLTWTAQTGGTPGNGSPAGSNSQVQFNDAGLFGADPGFTYDASNNTLHSDNIVVAANVTSNVVLTDSILHVNGSPWDFNPNPSGSNTQVQYNDNGSFAGSSNFTFDNVTNTLTASHISGNGSGLTALTGSQVTGTVANATYAVNSGTADNATNAITSTYAGTVTVSSQSNITSVGTLTSLVIGGPLTIQEGIEKVTANAIGSTGTVYFDLITQGIIYKTNNATSNFTIAFRGDSSTPLDSILTIGQSISCTYVNTVTTTGYIPTSFLIDGTSTYVYWNGTPPVFASLTGTSKDVYSFNIIKTGAGTFTILGTAGRYQ